MAERVGKRLRMLRHRNEMTQGELARASNVSRQQISAIEKGKYSLRLDTIESLLRGLRIKDAGALFNGIKVDTSGRMKLSKIGLLGLLLIAIISWLIQLGPANLSKIGLLGLLLVVLIAPITRSVADFVLPKLRRRASRNA